MEVGGGSGAANGKDTDTQLAGSFYFLLESSRLTALFRQDGIWAEFPHQFQLIGFAVQRTVGIAHLVETKVVIGDTLLMGHIQRTLALQDAIEAFHPFIGERL